MEQETSFKSIILTIRNWVLHLRKKFVFVLIAGIIGGLLGFAWCMYKPVKYVAQSNIVMDDESGISQAGLFSSVFGGGKSKGLYSNDNLVWLYSSKAMIERTLLAQVDSFGKPKLLINWFIELDKGLRKAVTKDMNISDPAKLFPFNTNYDSLSVEQTGFLAYACYILQKDYLNVEIVQKTENVVNVKFSSYDPAYGHFFVNSLVEIVNNYYVITKTAKIQNIVTILEGKLSGLDRNMKRTMVQAAQAIEDIPYANPLNQKLKIQPQRERIDVEINSALYVTLTQQLEQARLRLEQETPVIQVVDFAKYPLETRIKKWYMWIPIGVAALVILASIWVLIKQYYKQAMQEH